MKNLTRRQMFGMALAGLGSRFVRAADTDPTFMIVRSPSPTDLEMPLNGFKDAVTPIEHFFVRCHTYTPPKVNLDTWTLKVDGVVNKPLTLTMADIKKLPRVELVGVLECAGNGRSFYKPRVPGAQWSYGGAGNGRWAGVRLKDVLERAGLKSSATEVLCDGMDTPLGKMDDVRRTITVKKALHPDTLLAYEMNGEPLPFLHGFPLRVIAPGWAGDSWIKWLYHIEVLDHEYPGFWMKTGYRHPTHHVEPGTAVPASEMVSVTDLALKSVIVTPLPGTLTTASAKISGAAWSNGSPITGVDVSTDNGKSWKPATLGKDLGRYSWRLWEQSWTPSSLGDYTIIARARTADKVQPLEQEWNPGGYLWNGAPRVALRVDAPENYRRACFVCHDAHMMEQQHLTRAQWEKEVDKMTNWGAPVSAGDRGSIVDYLAGKYNP
ncbi:MAG TPA: sulfite oxidase [Bryobacteraceae bacterium]|nr:sulfite oxidase [Bryobacteraceae bacterium]